METNTKKLHPLLMAAAISLTVFSAVGVAALTGLLPHSKGSAKDETPVAALEAPAAKAEPVAPVQSAPAPAAKPAKKQVVRKSAPMAPAKAVETVAYNDYAVPPVVQAPPQTVEAPKPAVEVQKPMAKPGLHGIVESVREVEQKGDAKGIGAVGGGLAGAVLGHNIGEHNKLVTVLGAAGGALIGNQIEKQARATKHWELSVRYDDGTTQVFQSQEQPFWRQGDRVRLHEGKLQPV